MKNYIIGIALALVLVMGVAAFAEATTDPVPATPAVTEEAAAPTEETPAEDEQKALQDALDAYRKAKHPGCPGCLPQGQAGQGCG